MRSRHLSVLLVLLLPTVPVVSRAQETPAKAAPGQLVVTSSVEATRTALAAGLVEAFNARPQRAEKNLKLAVERDPGCALARAFYARYAPGLATAQRLKELDRAMADAAQATPPEQLIVKAVRETVAGNSSAAERLLRSAQDLVPDDPNVAYLRAVLVPGDEDRLVILQPVVQRFPGHAASVNLLAYALYLAGKRTDALVMAERYTSLLPRHPNPYDTYGELLQWDGDLEAAAQEYRRAVEMDPEFTEAYLGLAEVARLRYDTLRAREYLEDALAHAVAPEDRVTGFRVLAFDMAFAGDLEGVRRALSVAIEEAETAGLPASAAESHWLLAELEAADGHAAEATRELEVALGTPNPLNPLNRAWVYGALGNAAEVATALAELKGSVSAPAEPLATVRAVDAAVRGDVAAARTALAAVRTPDLRTPASALLLVALRKAGDARGVAAARALIEADRRVSAATAYAALLTREK